MLPSLSVEFLLGFIAAGILTHGHRFISHLLSKPKKVTSGLELESLKPYIPEYFRPEEIQEIMKIPENEEEYTWLRYVATLFAQIFLIFGGAIPYIPQYVEIHRYRNAQGFSLYVCLAIVMSSLLRISYWFRKNFELALLFQSVVMVLSMIIMLELCLRVERAAGRVRQEHFFMELEPRHFWRWTDLFSFLEAMILIFMTSTFTIIFLGFLPGVTEGVGYCALIIEAGLALPQFIRNFQCKTTHGMNKAMVCMWGLGDIFKLSYFIVRQVPLPFLLCSCFQFLLDLLIFAQIFVYGDHPKQT